MRRLSVVVVLLFAGAAPAQDRRTHAVTPDDYATLAAVTDLAVSPDGKLVAYCEARWDAKEDARRADLWVVPADGKSKPTRLTFDRGNGRHPRWSADGKHVYVLGNRKRAGETKPPYDGTSQVWRVPAAGGEAVAVTSVEGGVAGYDLAVKPEAVFYAAESTAPADDPFAKLRSQYDKLEYGDGPRKVSTVHRLDLQTWRAEKVVDEKRYVREFAVTRDGHRLAMITTPDDTVVTFEGRSRVDVWDAATGKVTPTDDDWRKSAASPWPWLESVAWNPAGDRLAYCTIFDAHPAEIIVNELLDGAWASRRVKRQDGLHVHGYGTPLHWLDDRAVAYLGEKDGRVGVYSYGMNSRDSAGLPAGPGEVTLNFAVSPTGTAITYEGSSGAFPELVRRGPDGGPITELNPQTKTWKLPTVEHVTWKAPDGTTVGGVLELPAGHKKGDKLPLVVAIHGGPTTSTKAELSFDPHNGRLYFAAAGYAVLAPNYRGSTGYGDKFVADLIGHENDVEVKDILAGIKHLVDEGIADPERVAVMGWSNGGYLTNCLVTLKDPPVKIRAASSGAGILDTVAEWGFNDEPAYPTVFKKGLPWETPENYRKTSPIYGLGYASTPTLIHVGGNDERCPPGHSRSLHRALKEYRKVPTELVVYPGEPHGLTKLSNRTAKMQWDLAWFEKYLK